MCPITEHLDNAIAALERRNPENALNEYIKATRIAAHTDYPQETSDYLSDTWDAIHAACLGDYAPLAILFPQ